MGRSRTPDREGSLASTGSGRTARSKKWDGEAGHRLHLSDLPVGVSKHEIEKLFRPYGELNEIWVASNPPCFAFINFTRHSDGERALKELDGTVIAGARVGLSWARPRHYGGRSRNRSPSPSRRRSYRDSYDSRRRRYSRSRSRSPRYRRSGGYRRRSPSSRSPSPKRSSKRDEHRRRRRSSRSSDRSDRRSERRDNKKRATRSPSNQRERSATPNGNNHVEITEDNHNEIEVEPQD